MPQQSPGFKHFKAPPPLSLSRDPSEGLRNSFEGVGSVPASTPFYPWDSMRWSTGSPRGSGRLVLELPPGAGAPGGTTSGCTPCATPRCMLVRNPSVPDPECLPVAITLDPLVSDGGETASVDVDRDVRVYVSDGLQTGTGEAASPSAGADVMVYMDPLYGGR